MRNRLVTALVIALAVAAAAWAFSRLDAALAIVMVAAGAVVIIAWSMPLVGVRLLDSLILAMRSIQWRREEGRHHAFGGVPLSIEDDGRHVWVEGDGLQRVLGTRDADDVLAARHSGRWRRARGGQLLLRVDAVVERLATGPGRLDPHTVRVRRYFEREVLFPAAERRRRRGQP